MKKLTCKIS